MAYVELGDIDASHYNLTKYPGIAKPSDVATLQTFKNLQAQLNRVAQGLSFSKISVDGDIGPGTVKLLGQIATNLGSGGVSVDPARNILIQAKSYTVALIAQHADMLGNAAQGVADQMNVPGKISQPAPIGGTGTIVSPTGVVSTVSTATPASASIADAFGGLDTTSILLAAGAIGAVIYFTGGKKKRGGSRMVTSTRRSRRFARSRR